MLNSVVMFIQNVIDMITLTIGNDFSNFSIVLGFN